jgi:hypothetical protein
MSNTLTPLATNRAGNVTIYRVLDGDVLLAYEQLAAIPPGRRRFGSDPETLRLVLSMIGGDSRVRAFYGHNHVRTNGKWFAIERGNAVELSGDLGVIFAVGVAPLPDSPPGLTTELSALEDDVEVAHRYIGTLAAGGMLAIASLSNEWRDALCSPSPSIPEARGVLRHPIYPDGNAEGWVNESEVSLPLIDRKLPHLHTLFSSIPMDDASRAALFSYLFAAFHKCSLNSPRPLLMVDSIEQGVGKSVTGEAIATLVDREPRTLSLDRNTNEGDEIVAQLACGNRCLMIPNLASKRNWNNTLLATLCTDVGQARRLKYASHATTFYGTLGITSTVLGAVSLHRDLVSRLWRVALSARAAPSLDVVPQEYAKAHRLELQAEIMACLAGASPYTGRVSTRFPDFERAGAAAYAFFTGRTHDEVAALMATAEKARHIFRDEVLYSLYHKHRTEFREHQQSWRGVPEGAEWLRQYDGAHAFGYVLKGGEWVDQ